MPSWRRPARERFVARRPRAGTASAAPPAGERLSDADEVHRLRLICPARVLGSGLEDIRELADTAFAKRDGSFEDWLGALLERWLAGRAGDAGAWGRPAPN
jgi:hypothetical protein